MNEEENHLIEQFLAGELSQEEKMRFLKRLEEEPDLREQVKLERQLLETFDEEGWSFAENTDSHQVAMFQEAFASEEAKKSQEAIAIAAQAYQGNSKGNNTRRLWFFSAAAVVLAVLSFLMFRPRNPSPERLYEDYLARTELPDLATRGDNTELLSQAQAYLNDGNYSRAATVLSEILEQGDRQAGIYINLAICQSQLDQFDDAIITLNKLIKSDLLDAQKGYWFKSLILLKSGNRLEARDLLQSIVASKYYNYSLAQELLEDLG